MNYLKLITPMEPNIICQIKFRYAWIVNDTFLLDYVKT